MATWGDFEAGAPSMAARGLQQLHTIPVGYLAAVRKEPSETVPQPRDSRC